MRATLLSLLLLLARPAAATQVLAMSVEETTDAAELVVRGTVEGVRTVRPDTAPGRIVTLATVRVSATLKGHAAASTLVVTVPGGQDGRFAQVVAGAPQLSPGDEVVLFLERVTRPDGALVVTGLAVGCWHVGPPPAAGPTHAVSRRRGLTLVQPDLAGVRAPSLIPAIDVQLPLPELLSRIAGQATKGNR